MNAKAKAEFDRLNEQDDRDARITKRAVERATIAYREEISRLQAQIGMLEMELNFATAELKRARLACAAAGVDIL